MLNLNDRHREFWPPKNREATLKYGKEAACQFAAMGAITDHVLSAFDELASHATNITEAQSVAHSFELLWDLLQKTQQEISDHAQQEREAKATND